MIASERTWGLEFQELKVCHQRSKMSRHNVAWALPDMERATGGEHSEEEVEMINRHFKS